jgi:hypothetical protein
MTNNVVYFFYDEANNLFYDDRGMIRTDIQLYLSPNDLFMFRQDPGYCIFPHRNIKGVLCEIVTDW